MKLSNMSIIFIIIIIPIILVLSYYISMQIDTINMQTSYATKQLDATKEAIEAFEINTVEWNSAYSENADSKRRDIMASINTFTTSFANSIGIGGTNKEQLETYIPAIACTLYDGYYIYAPSETKQVIKDNNGVAVFLTESIVKSNDSPIEEYTYDEEDEGKLLYKCKEDEMQDGIYNGECFTFNASKAVTTYEHILKPYSTYSARYKTDDGIDITINYTLDNYITITGTINGKYVVESGYLIKTRDDLKLYSETLTEKIWYKGLSEATEFTYVYAEDNTKVYFDEDGTTFQVNSNNIRTDLKETTDIKYKKVRENSGDVLYQALNDGEVNVRDGETGEVIPKEIKQGALYRDRKGAAATNVQEDIKIEKDYSSRNYYIESTAFTNWVKSNLSELKIGDIYNVEDKSVYGNIEDKIFSFDDDPEDEDSTIVLHKREVIKQTLISNLNQAITSYSRNTEGEYSLPVLTETDWNHVLRNVSIITFVQNIPIGLKYYNNYAIATSTNNKEFTNPDEIYLSADEDDYYHLPYCSHLKADTSTIIGYKNTDYVVQSYTDNDETNYYYKHSNIAYEACYYCLVQRDLYNSNKLSDKEEYKQEKAYKIALARERHRNISKINLKDDLEYDIKVTFNSNGGTIPEEASEKYVKYQGKYGLGSSTIWPEPSREGYAFKGWYTEADGGVLVTADTIVEKTSDHTLYAHWTQEKYTVTVGIKLYDYTGEEIKIDKDKFNPKFTVSCNEQETDYTEEGITISDILWGSSLTVSEPSGYDKTKYLYKGLEINDNSVYNTDGTTEIKNNTKIYLIFKTFPDGAIYCTSTGSCYMVSSGVDTWDGAINSCTEARRTFSLHRG